jgi:polyphosphate kinase
MSDRKTAQGVGSETQADRQQELAFSGQPHSTEASRGEALFSIAAALAETELNDPDLFLNRELSWLAFNERVLGEAARPDNPVMERLKFLTIFSSNLDEFFMVRLSGLLKLAERQGLAPQGASVRPSKADPLEVEETLDEVSLKIRTDLARAHHLLHKDILPELREIGLELVRAHELEAGDHSYLATYFDSQIFPILTPLAVDSAHPFPYLANLSLYLAVHFEETTHTGEPLLAFVEISRQLPRVLALPRSGKARRFVLIEDVVKLFLFRLFPWTQVRNAYLVRATRNLDYQLLEGEVQDLMRSIEAELKDREQKFVLRLEVEATVPEALRERLRVELDLDAEDVYEVPQIVGAADLRDLLKFDIGAETRDPAFNPRLHPDLGEDKNFFEVIGKKDLLLHHPFDSFVSIVEFVEQARLDPNVLAIKMTLYRGGGNSPIIESLLKAAEGGKQVTVVVELKARFDEETNIVWAKRLERAGAHVVFGFVGLKTHCKCLLVIRRERNALRRYVHLSTGNYNHSTAKFYTDIGLLTSNEQITQDVVTLFNLLTGFNIIGAGYSGVGATETQIVAPALRKSGKIKPQFSQLHVAPFGLRDHFLGEIEAEVRSHQIHGRGRIVLKMNALTDPILIKSLYCASRQGVRVDLLVRGVCILRPGVPGFSETITVRSVVDRFLEHSRVAWFGNDGHPRVFLGSADFMPRNMNRRIEVAWPVLDPEIIMSVTDILAVYIGDNLRSHEMLPDGSYRRIEVVAGGVPRRAQLFFIDHARKAGLKSEAYETALELVSPDATESEANASQAPFTKKAKRKGGRRTDS